MSSVNIVVDTNVFVAARNPAEAIFSDCRKLLAAVDEGRFRALISVVTLAELRAGFSTAELPALWTPFLSHLTASPNIAVELVDREIALTAGEIRREAGLRLPDALILATAHHRSAKCVATADREMLRGRAYAAAMSPSELLG
ncbi:MAG: PIN domain-containing protein [Thermoplasmata archaeon]